MAYQQYRVTGNPAKRQQMSNAVLQSKIGMLPQMLANQQRTAEIARAEQFQNQGMDLARRKLKEQKEMEGRMMGLEAGKLGLNLAMGDMNKTTIGDITRGTKNLWRDPGKDPLTTPKGGDTGWQGFSPGATLSSGLTGFGVGKLVGGKSKAKKALLGAGAGGLIGLLSGGANLTSGLTGLVSGGIGGLFS